ncbi:DEAD/DEAH box helicase [Azospirillum canadense]|uniref:DEAD/DEAH box helicase n=1 Tax=Azospirillum canadense TaxID=403962 RepID=UPI002227023A|nr:DEAD/DEAH box helicase [Azospirillum canadense]MCW2242785.1 superfamily II DNA or RNA helicase [Azospirillum canadense]
MKLRPYQEKNANEILALLERGVPGSLYVLPTAGGKTVVVVGGVIRTVVNHGWSVAFLVHRRELLQQSVRTLAKAGIPAAVVDPDHDPDPSALVHVASIDTLKARQGRLAAWLRTIRLVVIDEAHHTVAPGWQALLEAMPHAQRLGVTATPFRGDGKPLGALFDEVVRGPSVAELTAAGWLCPAEVWSPVASLDLTQVKISRGDYVASDLDRVMNDDAISRLAINQYTARMALEPAIAFCVSVDHARQVAKAFSRQGYRAVSVDGDMSTADRDAAIQGLASGDIQVLTSCEIVSEGTDVPVVAGAMLLRPTKSVLKYMQQVGRVLRIADGKQRACIIDMADNVRIHGMPESDRVWTLETGLVPFAHRTIRCPVCHRRFVAGPKCPSCGRTFRGWDTAAPRQLDMLADSAIRAMRTEDAEHLARSKSDLERIARLKGFASGWVYYAQQRQAVRDMQRRHA